MSVSMSSIARAIIDLLSTRHKEDQMRQDEIDELHKTLQAANERADYYRLKYLAVLKDGVHTGVKAIKRLKRKNDLKQAYVLAAEELFKVLEVFDHDESALPPPARLALGRMTEARKNCGLLRRKKKFMADGSVIVENEWEKT